MSDVQTAATKVHGVGVAPMSDGLAVVIEVNLSTPEEAAALRHKQTAAIRRFLESVADNRRKSGLSGARGSLGGSRAERKVVNE